MTRKWKPGLVADVTMVNGEKRQEHSPAFWDSYNEEWVSPTAGRLYPGEVWALDVRPLVVIDPEDREAVERLVGVIVGVHCEQREDVRLSHDATQAALREFANPTPPKPDEPQGLGAVVEDADAQKWILVYDFDPVDRRRWAPLGSVGCIDDWRHYDDIKAVRVLSPGVTS
jgi:hypothetical protein